MSSQLSRDGNNFVGGEQGAQGQELSQQVTTTQHYASALASKAAAAKIFYAADSVDEAQVETSYALRLKIKYETHYGQHLCVVGSIS